jgi:hypothetical protein
LCKTLCWLKPKHSGLMSRVSGKGAQQERRRSDGASAVKAGVDAEQRDCVENPVHCRAEQKKELASAILQISPNQLR